MLDGPHRETRRQNGEKTAKWQGGKLAKHDAAKMAKREGENKNKWQKHTVAE